MASGKLSNANLGESQKNVFGASAAVQTYVSAILQQADMKLAELPSLPDHQKVARQHAEDWNVRVLPGIVRTNADIIDFANQFTNFYDTLYKLADTVASNPKSQKDFIQGLTLLRNSISDKVNSSKKVRLSLTTFKSELMDDYKAFTSDAEAATNIYTKKDGEIASLSKQIDSIQATLDKEIGVMSGGAVGIVSGVVLILVGAFADIETAGLTTVLVIGGVGFLVGGITSEIAGGVEYALSLNEMTKLKERLAEDKQGLLGLKCVKGQLDGIVNHLGNANIAVDTLIQQWSSLKTDLNQVITDVEHDPGTYGPQLQAMLDKAKQDWGETLDLAIRIQPTGQLPVKRVKNIRDVLHIGG